MVFFILFESSYLSNEKNGSLVVVCFDDVRSCYRHGDIGAVHRLSTYRSIDILYVEITIHAILLTEIFAVYCQPTPTLIRRLHIWLYYTTTLDVATDIMRR